MDDSRERETYTKKRYENQNTTAFFLSHVKRSSLKPNRHFSTGYYPTCGVCAGSWVLGPCCMHAACWMLRAPRAAWDRILLCVEYYLSTLSHESHWDGHCADHHNSKTTGSIVIAEETIEKAMLPFCRGQCRRRNPYYLHKNDNPSGSPAATEKLQVAKQWC